MHTIWKAGTVAAVAAVVGAFFVGRVVADQPPLPDVGGAVVISPSAAPTPAADPSAQRPGSGATAGDRGRPGADDGARGGGDGTRGGGDDDSGPGDADDGARGDDDSGHGRGRGRGRGGDRDDDDVRTVGPSPVEVDDRDDRRDDDGGDDD